MIRIATIEALIHHIAASLLPNHHGKRAGVHLVLDPATQPLRRFIRQLRRQGVKDIALSRPMRHWLDINDTYRPMLPSKMGPGFRV